MSTSAQVATSIDGFFFFYKLKIFKQKTRNRAQYSTYLAHIKVLCNMCTSCVNTNNNDVKRIIGKNVNKKVIIIGIVPVER